MSRQERDLTEALPQQNVSSQATDTKAGEGSCAQSCGNCSSCACGANSCGSCSACASCGCDGDGDGDGSEDGK